MGRCLYKILTALLIFRIIFDPSYLEAAATSIAIIPIHDGVSDNISDELADSFSRALAGQGLIAVSKDKVEAVLKYYQKPIQTGDDAAAALIRAKEHYFNFDYPEAYAQATRAINLMGGKAGTDLRDAYITAAVIAKTGKEQEESARDHFRRALQIDPNYELDSRSFSPSVVQLFNEVRSETSSLPAGSIKVDSDPEVAEVFINGIPKGVTPVTISNLPAGDYSVAIKTNKYKPVEKKINVTAGNIIKIREKLVWAAGFGDQSIYNILSSEDEAVAQINEGVRIAELLRVSKVAMVDVDQAADGSGEIVVRMIDRRYKAGHNPIVVKYSAAKKGLEDNLKNAADTLLKQTQINVAENPSKYLDPDGVGDPVLLGKRKRQFAGTPAFWGILGGVVAAGGGGAAAALLLSGGGGSTSRTGSVNVQFR